jgi:hypothetical protein
MRDDGRLDPLVHGNMIVTAWRCEQCHRLQPADTTATALLIDDYGRLTRNGQTWQRVRLLRKLVVCNPCWISIEDGEKATA